MHRSRTWLEEIDNADGRLNPFGLYRDDKSRKTLKTLGHRVK